MRGTPATNCTKPPSLAEIPDEFRDQVVSVQSGAEQCAYSPIRVT